ncbi:MAG: tetratricopeptide repeat protein [Verrucomicrobia bacterium]|nr:tetratricopeptide repeat protein [Verrucomicrobiota bacterium]
MSTQIARIVSLGVLLAGVAQLAEARDSDEVGRAARGDWLAVRLGVGDNLSGLNALQSASAGYSSLSSADFTGARKAFCRASQVVAERTDTAVEQAAALVKSDAAWWSSHLLYADVLARAGRYAEAESAATRAVELAPSEPLPYLVRGLIHALGGNDGPAQGYIARAIEANPQLADGYVAQGILYLRQGKPAEAHEAFQVALGLAPTFAVAANARGVALCQQGRFEDAIRAFVFALDLDPGYEVPVWNLQIAKELAAAGRARVRIAVVAGGRAGGLGRRTLEIVVAEKDQLAKSLEAGAALVVAATGVNPVVVTEPEQLGAVLKAGNNSIVLGLSLREGDAQNLTEWPAVEAAVASQADMDVRLVTDGTRAAAVLARTISKQWGGGGQSQVLLDSWEIVASDLPASSALEEIAAVAVALRAQGADVRVYGYSEILPNWSLLPPEQIAAIPLILVPLGQSELATGEAVSLLSLMVAQMATGWAAHPEQGPRGGINACYFVGAEGGAGVFHPDFGWMRVGVPSGTGISVGVARDGSNPQVIISGTGKDVLIRLDIDHSHGQQPHVNIQVGQQNIHTDRDGVEIKPGDNVIVEVGGGKVVVKTNGQKVKEYEVPEADHSELVIIEREPDGNTSVTQGGKPVGQIQKKPDGTTVVRVGDKTIQIPVVPPTLGVGGTGNDNTASPGGGADKGRLTPGKDNKAAQDFKTLQDIVLVDSRGVTILRCPQYEPNEFPRRRLGPVPPGWIIVPGPDGPTIAPDPRDHEHYPVAPKPPPGGADRGSEHPRAQERGGVYVVDDTTLEVVSAKHAGTDILLGASRPKGTASASALECPFLIFPKAIPKK